MLPSGGEGTGEVMEYRRQPPSLGRQEFEGWLYCFLSNSGGNTLVSGAETNIHRVTAVHNLI